MFVALFVILDVVLVGVAIGHVRSDPPPSDIVSAESSQPSNDESANEQRAFSFKSAEAGFLDVSNDDTFITATRGSCSGDGGTIRTSDDGGATLAERDAGVDQVLAVQAANKGKLTVVGTELDCKPVQRSSDDGGKTWSDDSGIDLWYPSITDTHDVVTPDGTSTPPGCTVISLSQVGQDFGRVACADGKLFGSGNQGKKWVLLGRLDNIRVLTFSTFNSGYALARFQGCAANLFSTDDSGRTWKAGGCITGDPARALAVNDTGLTAVVGEPTGVFVSETDGKDWMQP
ncbi:hypothetical protein ASD11_14075 [Aeromicrobium sp. Root495]|nr:hypothetical protein ASD11_14075 [Aeromicrobium sp. Root495]